jgi:hypothetical protein
MPKVECFEIPGVYCWFWSNDHDPPHFHAKREGEWEIRVRFTESEEGCSNIYGEISQGEKCCVN